MKLLVYMQDEEWYGEDEFSGRWKPKIGDTVEVAALTLEQATDKVLVASIIEKAKKVLQVDNKFCRSIVADFAILEDTELTESETSQMRFSGEIVQPRTVRHI